jgi:hypothetical protein
MLSKYEVIGRERVVYKGVVLANSSDEAEEKFRGYLKYPTAARSYEMFVSGIELEVQPVTEEE